MRLNLFLTLLDYKRVPTYLNSLFFAYKEGILGLRKEIFGMITIPECVVLYKFAKSLPNKSKVVEIGSYGGLSSAYIIYGLRKKSSFLYSIDPFGKEIDVQKKIVSRYHNSDYRKAEFASINNKPTKSQVERKLHKLNLTGFKLIEGYSFEVVKKWKKRIDMLFIDGNHEYPAVLNDFNKWKKYLKKGGLILFHDANNIDYKSQWDWGLEGPTKVVSKYIFPPKWIKIGRVDSMVYAVKNY